MDDCVYPLTLSLMLWQYLNYDSYVKGGGTLKKENRVKNINGKL